MRIRNAILVMIVAGLLPALASALEVEGMFDLSNLDFPGSQSSTATTFDGGTYSWGMSFSGTQQISDSIAVSTGFEIDPILRNISFASVSFKNQYFQVDVGPYFGLFNSTSTFIKTGLSASVSAYLPGIAFLTLDSATSLGGALIDTGDYVQTRSEASIGAYLPNVITSFHISQKSYTSKETAGNVVDSLTEYALHTDIFEKNVPYNLLLRFAFQMQKKYFDYSTPVTQSLDTIAIGSRLTIHITDAISYVVDLDASIYTFGLDAFTGVTVADKFLFRGNTGIQINLDRMFPGR